MSESAKIILTLPSGEVRKYGLEMESIRIGRAADNTVVIEDPSLSAHHCVLRRVGAGSNFSLEDLESTNGLEVNGEETTMAELSHADVVKIGEIMMLFMQAGRPRLDPLPPFVKTEQPANNNDTEDNDDPVGTEDDSEEDKDEEEFSEDDDDTPPLPKQKKEKKPKSTPKPRERESRQDYVQVEESGGCGSAIVSLLILLLAPVAGLCFHHFLSTGRFLLLDLVSGLGQ